MWSTWSTLALTKIYMRRFEDLIFSIASEKLNDCLSLKSQGGEREKSVFVIFFATLRNEAAAAQQTICFFEKKNERSANKNQSPKNN